MISMPAVFRHDVGQTLINVCLFWRHFLRKTVIIRTFLWTNWFNFIRITRPILTTQFHTVRRVPHSIEIVTWPRNTVTSLRLMYTPHHICPLHTLDVAHVILSLSLWLDYANALLHDMSGSTTSTGQATSGPASVKPTSPASCVAKSYIRKNGAVTASITLGNIPCSLYRGPG